MHGRLVRYITVGVIGFLLGGVGGAFAAGTIPGPNGMIWACYRVSTSADDRGSYNASNKNDDSAQSGQLRLVVDASQCGKNEKAISWNQTGPVGAIGPKGDAGTNGLLSRVDER